jgi:polyhydroxyalkanoate synthesis regulator phasin
MSNSEDALSEKAYQDLKDRLAQDYFLIRHAKAYWMMGGLLAAFLAILGVGYKIAMSPEVKASLQNFTANVKETGELNAQLRIAQEDLKRKNDDVLEQARLAQEEVRKKNDDVLEQALEQARLAQAESVKRSDALLEKARLAQEESRRENDDLIRQLRTARAESANLPDRIAELEWAMIRPAPAGQGKSN